MDSGMLSISSPPSIPFFAKSLILARLRMISTTKVDKLGAYLPVLEPDLDGALGHVDLFCDSLSDRGSWCWVLVELDLECRKLVLGRTLSFLVLLLLGEGALARWSPGRGTGSIGAGLGGGCWRWRRHLFRLCLFGMNRHYDIAQNHDLVLQRHVDVSRDSRRYAAI